MAAKLGAVMPAEGTWPNSRIDRAIKAPGFVAFRLALELLTVPSRNDLPLYAEATSTVRYVYTTYVCCGTLDVVTDCWGVVFVASDLAKPKWNLSTSAD